MIAQPKVHLLKTHKVLIQEISEKEFDLTIIDYQNLSVYLNKKIQLKKLLSSTLLKAFSQEDKMISYQFTKEKDNHISLIIIVSSPFLQNIEEEIALKKVRNISEQEAKLFYLQKLEQKFLKAKSHKKNNKICATLNSIQFHSNMYNGGGMDEDYGMEEDAYEFSDILTLKIQEKGRYLITFSALVKDKGGQYFYIYQNRDYNIQILPNSCVYMPISNQFIPLTFSYVQEVNTNTISFQAYDTYDYPCELKNIVATAEKLEQN